MLNESRLNQLLKVTGQISMLRDRLVTLKSLAHEVINLLRADLVYINLKYDRVDSVGIAHSAEGVSWQPEAEEIKAFLTTYELKDEVTLIKKEQKFKGFLAKPGTISVSVSSTELFQCTLLVIKVDGYISEDLELVSYLMQYMPSVVSNLKYSEEMQAKIHYLENYDFSLTDLPNRLLFKREFEQIIKTSSEKGGTIALLYLDIDNFKDINDESGHEVGDNLLIELSKRLQELQREHKHHIALLARMSGDEFAIILHNVKTTHQIETIAGEIIRYLKSPFFINDRLSSISVSMGISVYPNHGTTSKDLLRHADAAMYSAKAQGKGKYRFYSPKP